MSRSKNAEGAKAYLSELYALIRPHHKLVRPRRDWWNPPLLQAATVGLAMGAMHCSGTVTSSPVQNPGEVCDDGIDNDGDGLVDCADPDCGPCTTPLYAAPHDAGADTTEPDATICTALETCLNGVDDDCDGLTDCLDPDCADSMCCLLADYAAPFPTEICTNGMDDDCDGLTDCADPDCAANVCCAVGSMYMAPAPAESCANGVDDDCDGVVDCADSDCYGSACCMDTLYGGPMPAEDCANGLDDDCDGQTDCADQDCVGSPDCGVPVYAAPS